MQSRLMLPPRADCRRRQILARVCTDIAFIKNIKNMPPIYCNHLGLSRCLALVFVGGVFLAAALPDVVHGYALEGPKWPNGSNPAAQLELGAAGKTLSDGNTSWNAAVSPAIDMWNQVMGGIQLNGVNSTASISQGDRLNSLSFGGTYFGH